MVRYWSKQEDKSGSVHCLSNGRLAVYEKGPEIINVFGPVFSAPDFFTLTIDGNEYAGESLRVKKSLIWKHKILKNGNPVGVFTDFTGGFDGQGNYFIRQFAILEPVRLNLLLHVKTEKEGDFYHIPQGADFYGLYPCPIDVYMRISGQNYKTDGNVITLNKCEGFLVFQIEDGKDKFKTPDGKGVEKIFRAAKEYFIDETDGVLKNLKAAPGKETPLYEKEIEDLYFTVVSQLSFDGGGMAGHRYNLSYVRDMYGVFKALLALKLKDKAKALLKYYLQIFEKCGMICNAQPMGFINGLFHVHENDEAEITGYLILQAMEYYKLFGDKSFVVKLKEMLLWAFERQISALNNNMLPFNGDETYIAGGLLPRSAIDDGSFEYTLIFITGGEKLLDFFEFDGLIKAEKLAEYKKIIKDVKTSFRDNFFQKGKIMINNPKRRDGLVYKTERRGVCNSCGSYAFLEKLKGLGDGYFVCPLCEGSPKPPKTAAKVYELPMLMLMPAFTGSDIFTAEELKRFAGELMKEYKAKGTVSVNKSCVVGYEYGLLLNFLTLTGNENKAEIFEKLLTLIDDTGSFAEYYNNDTPFNTRYRPWESAINLYAVIQCIAQRA